MFTDEHMTSNPVTVWLSNMLMIKTPLVKNRVSVKSPEYNRVSQSPKYNRVSQSPNAAADTCGDVFSEQKEGMWR